MSVPARAAGRAQRKPPIATRYIAVVGPGEDAMTEAIDDARAIGRLIALRQWLTLTGGRAAGVMAAAIEGAANAGGVTVAILPGFDRRDAAPGTTVALPTGLGEARNVVLVNAADGVVACGISPGTAAELALASRGGRPTVLVRPAPATAAFFTTLGDQSIAIAADAEAAMAWLEQRLRVKRREVKW